jgi:hypothetical protein
LKQPPKAKPLVRSKWSFSSHYPGEQEFLIAYSLGEIRVKEKPELPVLGKEQTRMGVASGPINQ